MCKSVNSHKQYLLSELVKNSNVADFEHDFIASVNDLLFFLFLFVWSDSSHGYYLIPGVVSLERQSFFYE